MRDPRTLLALSFALLMTVGIGGFVLWTINKGEEQTKETSTELIRAIETNDPSAAPGDTGDYVKGVRGYFGRIETLRYLDGHTVRVGEGKQATTYPVTELLLHARRGAAVLELEFRRGGITEDYEISDIEELEPDDVRSDLAAEDEAAVERGFRRRGRRVARPLVLDGSFTDSGRIRRDTPSRRRRGLVPKPPEPKEVARKRRESLSRLECVKRANQDVEKLKKC